MCITSSVNVRVLVLTVIGQLYDDVILLQLPESLNLSRPRLIKLAKIWKPLLLLSDCALDKDGAPRVVST